MFWDFWVEEFEEDLLKGLGFGGACVVGGAKSSTLRLLKLGSDFTVLESGDEAAQRKAVKQCSVDAIRGFPGVKILKEMSEKNIALLIAFSDLLNSNNLAKTLFFMARVAKTAKKKKTPIVICSGARNRWELRSVSELIGFGEALGLTAKEAKEALFKFQEKIWERQKLKRSGKYISVGVVKI